MAADMSGGASLPPPTSNEGQYLAALLDEIRQLRQDLAAARPPAPPAPPAGEVELRELGPVETPAGPRRRRGN